MNQELTQDEVIKLLSDYQESKGFGLKEFADKLGVTPQYLAGIYAKNQFPNEKVGFKKIKTVMFIQVKELK